jgi:hypothetical protein
VSRLVTAKFGSYRSNAKLARWMWGALAMPTLKHLKELTEKFRLSIAAGDLLLLEGRWYVTHTGLLRLAERLRCAGIKTSIERALSDPNSRRWVCKAVVYKRNCRGPFTGYGDADPSNVSALGRGAEVRIAETRAVNRALRKAYGIGLCSVEELGYLSSAPSASGGAGAVSAQSNGNSSNGHFRLRDRLCLLIRQHQLDPILVKRYAADFCGTQELREASRDLVESFITHLAEWAAKDRTDLVCKLNGYAQTQEVRP